MKNYMCSLINEIMCAPMITEIINSILIFVRTAYGNITDFY